MNQEYRELLRRLMAQFNLPSDTEIAEATWASVFYRRIRSAVGGGLLDEVKNARALMAAYRARIAAAAESREAASLARMIAAMGRRAFGSMPRAANEAVNIAGRARLRMIASHMVRAAARHPLVMLLIVVVLVGLYVYNKQTQAGKVQVAGLIDCDCPRIDAGILTGGWQQECRASEQNLKTAAKGCSNLSCVRTALKLKTGPDGGLASGAFCGDMQGPYAWPTAGKPEEPPPKPEGPRPCTHTEGLAQACR